MEQVMDTAKPSKCNLSEKEVEEFWQQNKNLDNENRR